MEWKIVQMNEAAENQFDILLDWLLKNNSKLDCHCCPLAVDKNGTGLDCEELTEIKLGCRERIAWYLKQSYVKKNAKIEEEKFRLRLIKGVANELYSLL